MASTAFLKGALAAPDHSAAFRTRRFLNWFPLGLAYAFLYMGRYNLNVAKNALGSLMTAEDFGIIFFFGTLTYGIAFLANGPVTDRIGGRKAMLIAVLGASVTNLAMGLYLVDPSRRSNEELRLWFSVLYSANMYFQSFGAVAIVKVNSSWFHVRERGGFSGIFGTMISSGIFMAYTVNGWLLGMAAVAAGTTELQQANVVFLVPALLLGGIALLEFFLLRDHPSQAGLQDFDTGDASSGAADVPLRQLFVRILTNPIILTVALIEFCTGVVRQGVMQWYPIYARSVLALPSTHYMQRGSWGNGWIVAAFFLGAVALGLLARRLVGARKGWLYSLGGLLFLAPFLQGGWGGLLFVAGVIGGNAAGHVSDLFFQSRRAPAAGGLYGLLFVCMLLMVPAMGKTTAVVAQTQVPGLQPGDRILEVAGTKVSEWPDVALAIQAVPPQECLLGSSWDSDRKICSIRPEATGETTPPSTGVIPLLIDRGGQTVQVPLQDWAVKQRAGEPRVLKGTTPEATSPPYLLGALVFVMSLCVIGTHGLLSGTATMDFGGRKGAATAVGMIDGFVYLGTAVQSLSLGYLTSRSWSYWPWFMMPFALVGFLLCLRIWNAKPRPRAQTPEAPARPAQEVPSVPGRRTGTGG